jgi:hypothetical protein
MDDMLRTQDAGLLPGWQHRSRGGFGNNVSGLLGGCVCSLVLTTSKGVTGRDSALRPSLGDWVTH